MPFFHAFLPCTSSIHFRRFFFTFSLPTPLFTLSSKIPLFYSICTIFILFSPYLALPSCIAKDFLVRVNHCIGYHSLSLPFPLPSQDQPYHTRHGTTEHDTASLPSTPPVCSTPLHRSMIVVEISPLILIINETPLPLHIGTMSDAMVFIL